MEFKWADDLLQKKINEKIVENLMEKLSNHSDVVAEVIDHEIARRNLIESLSTYECKYGFAPNKIIMGYNVYQYFQTQFRYEYIKGTGFDFLLDGKTNSYFWGVPIELDKENTNRLEIGHMIKLS